MLSLRALGSELGQFLAHRHGELDLTTLTPRQVEVMQLAAEGCSGREIAERLFISTTTVKSHFASIYERLGVSDRAAAVAEAMRCGLIG
jgi:DNA-binding NarL/FixJ family response regulator